MVETRIGCEAPQNSGCQNDPPCGWNQSRGAAQSQSNDKADEKRPYKIYNKSAVGEIGP